MAETDDLWGEILAGLSGPARPRRLVLNDANGTVRDLLASPDAEVRAAGARSLYVTAVLASGKALQPVEAALMNDSLSLLLARALATSRPDQHTDQNADEENR